VAISLLKKKWRHEMCHNSKKNGDRDLSGISKACKKVPVQNGREIKKCIKEIEKEYIEK
jgi:hypothetical protein